jgi:hypothetical protein
MRRLRFHIGGLMLSLLPVAIGLAALLDPSEFRASALFSLTILALLTSVLGTVARRGAARMAFLDFALFGISYLVLTFGPWAWINPDGLRPPPLVTRMLLDQAQKAKPGLEPNWEERRERINWNGRFNQLSFGPADATLMPLPSGQVSGLTMYLAFDISPYKQIVHSMLALVAGGLGAIAGRIMAPREADSPQL